MLHANRDGKKMQAEFEGSKFIYIAITNDLYTYVKEPSIYAFFPEFAVQHWKFLFYFSFSIAKLHLTVSIHVHIYLLLNEILIWQKVNHSVKNVIHRKIEI